MNFKKYISSALILGMCISGSMGISFANENTKNKGDKNKEIIQQQLDAFDAVDQQIKNNRSQMVLPDKESNGLTKAGTYPTRKGVILVTKDGKLDKLVGHAGIVYNSSTTVESFPQSRSSKNINGVTTYSNTWNSRYKTVYGVTTSGTTVAQDASTADYAYAYRGKPYNWVFTDTETASKFYCSQLVYKAYKYKIGINLNQGGGIVFPIDLVQSGNTRTIYTKGV